MSQSSPPKEFLEALRSLRDIEIHPSLVVVEVPSPIRLAPWSAAVEIATMETEGDRPLGTATLVVLYDPDQKESWGGPLRLVGYSQVQIDAEQSTDPLLGEAIWNTVIDGLEASGAGFSRLVGTVTRELSETFGGLQLMGSALKAELRCSWSPSTKYIGEHLQGWADALRQTCGIEPATVAAIGSI